MFKRPPSRKELPGLTFIFSLPEPARSIEDFPDTAPCKLWKPSIEPIAGAEGPLLFAPTGKPLTRLVYREGAVTVPFLDLKNACLSQAHAVLPWGTPFELRLALPMGLDDPERVQVDDLWRVGYVSYPGITKKKERRGIRETYGYYLLAKRVAGTPLILEKPEQAGEKNRFLGAERLRWADRFRKA